MNTEKLVNAVEELRKECVENLEKKLNTLDKNELVAKGLETLPLKIIKQGIDADDGRVYCWMVYHGQNSKSIIPIFTQGSSVSVAVLGLVITGRVKEVLKKGYIVSLEPPEYLCGLVVTLKASPDSLIFDAMLSALAESKVIMESKDDDMVKPDPSSHYDPDETIYQGLIKSGILTDTGHISGTYGIVKLMLQRSRDNNEAIIVDKLPSLDAERLNHRQMETVLYSLQHPVTVVHGPPGTGKSLTLASLTGALLEMNEKVAICAPSHVAIDSLVSKILDLGFISDSHELLRLGHPNKINPEVKSLFSVQARLAQNEEYSAIKATMKELAATVNGVSSDRIDYPVYMAMHRDLHSRMLEVETKNLSDLVEKSRIVAGTFYAIGKLELPPNYTTLLIDEISQSVIPQCLIPALSLSHGYRLVVCGDNKQLAPTIESYKNSIRNPLMMTLFDTLQKQHGVHIHQLLDVQYRMSQSLMDFPSQYVYGGHLQAHSSVQSQLLSQLPTVRPSKLTRSSLVWVEMANTNSMETYFNHSRGNAGEAAAVRLLVAELVTKHRVLPQDIAVITPYSYQKFLVSTELQRFRHVEVSSIDGFQGREKNVIILSMVKSMGTPSMGFIEDARRLNVAITRARCMLCVVGNSKALKACQAKTDMLKQFTSFCLQHGKVINVRADAHKRLKLETITTN